MLTTCFAHCITLELLKVVKQLFLYSTSLTSFVTLTKQNYQYFSTVADHCFSCFFLLVYVQISSSISNTVLYLANFTSIVASANFFRSIFERKFYSTSNAVIFGNVSVIIFCHIICSYTLLNCFFPYICDISSSLGEWIVDFSIAPVDRALCNYALYDVRYFNISQKLLLCIFTVLLKFPSMRFRLLRTMLLPKRPIMFECEPRQT